MVHALYRRPKADWYGAEQAIFISGTWRSHVHDRVVSALHRRAKSPTGTGRQSQNKNKMPIKFHYVYVLRSLKDGLFYIGFSDDLKIRVKDHNAGKNISTKNRRPLELVFYEAFSNKPDALRRESYFKTTKGKVTLRQMLREYLVQKI
jgi:putative endonuclease